MVLSPSAGSSQRGTGVKCMPMVSVPSGAAATPAAPPTQSTAHRIGPRTRRRVRENGVIGRDCIIGALSTRIPGRPDMARRSVLAVAVGLVMLAVVGVSFMSAQPPAQPVNDKPLTERWAPTEWGPNDKAGSVNRTTPAMVMKAMRLVKQGKVATLGKLYHSSIPAFGARSWTMSIPGTPTGGPFGKNALVYHDELVTTEIGQIGTQFDGPGHIGVNTSKGPMMYNGRITWDNYERGPGGRVLGMGPMGVEHVGELGFVCRLVVLDAVAYRKSQGKIPASAEML